MNYGKSGRALPELGVKITWWGRQISCSAYRTKEKNLAAAMAALCLLEDRTIDEMFFDKTQVGQTEFEIGEGKVETFRSY